MKVFCDIVVLSQRGKYVIRFKEKRTHVKDNKRYQRQAYMTEEDLFSLFEKEVIGSFPSVYVGLPK